MKNFLLIIVVIANCAFGCEFQVESRVEPTKSPSENMACKNFSSIEIERLAVNFINDYENKRDDYKTRVVPVNDSICRVTLWPVEVSLGGNVELEFNMLTCSFAIISRGK